MILALVSRRKMLLRVTTVFGIFALIGIDLASTLQAPSRIEAIPVSQLKNDGVPADYATQVALVRSDDSTLASPDRKSVV